MGIASGKNNSVVALWKRVGTVISPKTDGDDINTTGTFSGINVTSGESPGHTHDNSYYTETEVDSNYLAIDGSNADQDIDIDTYNFSTTGKLGATVLENTAGDLKLQPDATGDVVLFEDRDWNGVADYTTFDMHRKDSSATGNSRFRIRIDPWGQGYFSFTGSHFLFSGGGDLRYTATKDLDLRQTDPTYAINFGSRWDEDENQKVKYYGGDGSVVKYVQFQLGSDMYFKTTPKDATVLGWNIWMDVAVDGDITADNLGTASAEDVGYFEPAKGTDDNFVTDYQLSILSTLVSHTWVNS